MFKYETHLHTSEASGCASCCGADMADGAKNAGYDGIIVTDHFFNGNSAVPWDLPWDKKIDLYCLGYENALKRGKEIGLDVFFGWEYTYMGSDFLTYGLDKRWLKMHPEIMDMKIYDYADSVAAEGGFIVHAHPFREACYIKQMTFIPDKIGAVEVVNTRNSLPIYNERAKWFAESYNLPQTAGSDAHAVKHLTGGVFCDTKINSVEDYINAVKNRKVTVIEQK